MEHYTFEIWNDSQTRVATSDRSLVEAAARENAENYPKGLDRIVVETRDAASLSKKIITTRRLRDYLR